MSKIKKKNFKVGINFVLLNSIDIVLNSKQKNYGFSSGNPWLPCDKKFEKLSVDIQENDKNSMLNFTREKISQRKIN